METNYFEKLYRINVNDYVEEKNGLKYCSWSYVWAEIKKAYPDANYTVYENKDGWNYFTDGRTGWVKTGVTVNGIEHIEYLPIMDFKNKSIPADNITSFDVNKTIQRSLTKACARHGLGLYIYAGEDLPEEDSERAETLKNEIKAEKARQTKEINKKVAEYQKSKEGVMERLKNAQAYLSKIKQLEPYGRDKILMTKITDLSNDMFALGLNNEMAELDKIVNEKMPKEEEDCITY